MIVTKQALRECIQFEQKWYENYMFKTPRRKFMAKIKSESFYQIMNWQRISRMTDYYHYIINNESSSILSKILYIYYIRKRNILSARLGLEIGTENIGKGLVVYHYNNVVNGLSKIGENLHLHGGNVIGNAGPQDPRCPTIGNNVMLGAGAKVIGNVYIADNIKIAAGAVVVNSFDTPGITIAGVPAKRVK